MNPVKCSCEVVHMLRVEYHFKAVSFNFCFINFPISLQTYISEDISQVHCINTKKQDSYGLFWRASPWGVHTVEGISANVMIWVIGGKILKTWRTRDEGQGHKAWIFLNMQRENRGECIWITGLPLLQFFSPTFTFSPLKKSYDS